MNQPRRTILIATNASGCWSTGTIVEWSAPTGGTSLAVDSNDDVHISYYDTTNKDLKYVHCP